MPVIWYRVGQYLVNPTVEENPKDGTVKAVVVYPLDLQTMGT